MRLFVPLPTLPQSDVIPRMKGLTQQVKTHLLELMKIITEDFPSVQDAFDFRDGAMTAQFDTHRGESEFMVELKLNYALLTSGFHQVSGVGFEVPPQDSHANVRHTNAYLHGNDLVVVHTEVSDRGKHKFHDIRFCVLDPRHGLPQTLQR